MGICQLRHTFGLYPRCESVSPNEKAACIRDASQDGSNISQGHWPDRLVTVGVIPDFIHETLSGRLRGSCAFCQIQLALAAPTSFCSTPIPSLAIAFRSPHVIVSARVFM